MKTRLLKAATWLTERFPALTHTPKPLKNLIIRNFFPEVSENPGSATKAQPSPYEDRLARETEIFSDQLEVNDLPPIFHYWSNAYLRPKLEQFGFSNPDQFFAHFLQKSIADQTSGIARIASIGAGNCDTEVRVATLLLERGVRGFSLDCIDINAKMLERGAALAREAGVEGHINPVQVDFNAWNPVEGSHAAIMANQSLHHVLELETLFASIDRAMCANGRFLTADMIGRNGHMRWPEAMRIIHEYWRELPESYRWNVQLQRHEELLEEWDCSVEGFEGIRAQDILPLLVERFDFEFFLPFGNLVDPFIDRSFGPHFDPELDTDRQLIDRIHARDESEILAGTIKPTHMFGVMRKRPYVGEHLHLNRLTPEFCIRDPKLSCEFETPAGSRRVQDTVAPK